MSILDETNIEHRQKWKHYKSSLEKKRDVIAELDSSIFEGIKDEEIEKAIEETLEYTEMIHLSIIALDEAKIHTGNEDENVGNTSQQESQQPLEGEIHNILVFRSVTR